MIVGVVLAAGAGRRFGGEVKQLAPFAGQPLVARAVAAVGALDLVLVVVGAHADAVAAAVDPDAATVVRCADWADGQSASLRAGVGTAQAAGAEAVVVTLGDQPLVGAEAVARVVAARGEADAVRACYHGAPGHPVLMEASMFGAVAGLRGDRGARELLGDARLVECADVASPADADTPAQLDALSARR